MSVTTTSINRKRRSYDATIRCVPSCLSVRTQIVISMPIHIMIRRDVPHCLCRMLFHCKTVESVPIRDAAKCCQCVRIRDAAPLPLLPPPPHQLAQKRINQHLTSSSDHAVVVVPRNINSKAIHCHDVSNQRVAPILFSPTCRKTSRTRRCQSQLRSHQPQPLPLHSSRIQRTVDRDTTSITCESRENSSSSRRRPRE